MSQEPATFVDRSLYEPVYAQLVRILLGQIAAGVFRPGDRLPSEAQLCERYGVSPMTVRRVINILADQGVVIGQAVIDGLGIVGQVEDVHRHFSTVRLISDPDHALPVQINRTGLRTVAFGRGQTNYLLMPNVPLQTDVSPGDLVVTSGLGDRFPPGFPVGEVERVDRDSGETFATVYMRPFAALDRGREVLLIEPQRAAETLPLEQP